MFKVSIVYMLLVPFATGFTTIQPNARQPIALSAKKGKGKAKGFGKQTETAQTPTKASQQLEAPGGFSSIEDVSVESFSRPQIEVDPNLSTDERNKAILKQQFGLRSYEEQQGDIKAAERAAENQKRMQQVKQMKDEDFDIFMVIPPPVIKGIDAFLKFGLTVTTGVFILAGFGITAEAWAVATNHQLPDNIDNFIVNTIEPNFTTALLVLLGFSVSLGIFATAQLGSGSSIYKEEP